MQAQTITSFQNPKIKFLYQLKEKSRIRKKEQRFVIEGKREFKLATKGNYTITQLYYCSSIICKEEIDLLLKTLKKPIDLFEITLDIYQKLTYRSTTEGILAIAVFKNMKIEHLSIPSKKPLILVAEALEKPGNIGALLRTADAAQVDAVLIADPKTDIYNPNIIRSSIGCVFTTTIATGSTKDIIHFLAKNNIKSYGAALQASVDYTSIDYTEATAIIVGTEATGLSNEFLSNTFQNIKIPMGGIIDSMNVSVAAGILVFEAKRQRKS